MNDTMSAVQVLSVFFGIVSFGLAVVSLQFLFRSLTVSVEDETETLIMRFGKLSQVITLPGLHFVPEKILPWTSVIHVSKQLDFRHYKNIHVNDALGTTMILELWVEFRIADTVSALFRVEDWERSLQSTLTHSASSILGTKLFENILTHRIELGEFLRTEIAQDTQRWGIAVESVFIRKVGLLPEVSQQMFNTVAARLELAKAKIEEDGRLKVALLDAETESTVATLVAEAKGQYPAAVGAAYVNLRSDPAVLAAYTELYELSRVKPHRTVAFQGFGSHDLQAIDAAMLNVPTEVSSGHGGGLHHHAGASASPLIGNQSVHDGGGRLPYSRQSNNGEAGAPRSSHHGNHTPTL